MKPIFARSAARTTTARTLPHVIIETQARIPGDVVDLASFHRWIESDEAPKTGRFCFLNGAIWVDLSMEQLFTHNRCKNKYIHILDDLANGRLGYLFSDGVRLSNVHANLSTEPDLLFVTFGGVESNRVRLIPGKKGGFTRVQGSPEMVLEIVSDESVEKDTELLREMYWDASISEFWLVDVRGDAVKFDILRHGSKGYVRTRPQTGGWLRSQVFGKSFRLTRGTDRLGNPEFTLLVRK